MQTVNFSCGHCGNLMAVALELLGQHVRCPHCQQVVVAPSATTPTAPPSEPPPPAPPEPEPYSFSSPAAHEEDIFTPKEVHDDLFADSKPAALEIPAEPSWPNAPAVAPAPPAADNPPPAPPRESVPAATGPDPLVFGPTANHAADALGHPTTATEGILNGDSATRLTAEAPAPADDRMAVRRVKEGSNGAVIVLIFLIPYALLMTGVAVYFYWNAAQQHHPLEFLPDWPGEHPGATRKGQEKVSSVYERVTPESPLPARLRVGLHRTLRVGNLEVTPERVEQKKVVFCYDPPKYKPEPSSADALVLILQLRNVSRDEVFYPTDPGFEARWTPGQPKPYTFLELGPKKFFGGALDWELTARKPGSKGAAREYIQGQEFDNQPLQPGDKRSTVVCTDPNNAEVLKAVQKNPGPMLWRVRLRRGLARYNDREVCVSAVVGVEFTARDIIRTARHY